VESAHVDARVFVNSASIWQFVSFVTHVKNNSRHI